MANFDHLQFKWGENPSAHQTTASSPPWPEVLRVLIKEQSGRHSSIRGNYSMLLCQVSVRNRKSKSLELNKLFSVKDLFTVEWAFISAIQGYWPTVHSSRGPSQTWSTVHSGTPHWGKALLMTTVWVGRWTSEGVNARGGQYGGLAGNSRLRWNQRRRRFQGGCVECNQWVTWRGLHHMLYVNG